MNDYLFYAVTHNDILYTGMMYHEEKKVGYWKTIYSVVKDLDVLKKVALSLQQYSMNISSFVVH